MNSKCKLAVIFGGKSGEHEVSLMSATNVLNAIDKDKYDVVMIGITKEGKWLRYEGDVSNILNETWQSEAKVFNLSQFLNREEDKIDVIFPVLHGPNGEDGTFQGFFEMCDVAYVGCNVLSSAICMDKEIAKIVFADAGLTVVPYTVVYRRDLRKNRELEALRVEKSHSYPVFVKPANMGSSVGVSKAGNRGELLLALEEAAKHDRKIIVEKAIVGRELEVAVLGNDEPKVSGVGEIIPSHEFYDYVAKYFDGDNSRILIPAPMDDRGEAEVREAALKAFLASQCSGLARVDFFKEKGSEILYINEINTMPGFTRISMYPKLWQNQGLSYSELIDELIELAIEEYREKSLPD